MLLVLEKLIVHNIFCYIVAYKILSNILFIKLIDKIINKILFKICSAQVNDNWVVYLTQILILILKI